jgi:hypothetical protein
MTRTTIIALGLLFGSGCFSRTHLTESHGRSTRAAFSAQAANPDAANKPHKQPGLTAHEAKIVLNNFDRAHTAKGASAAEDQGMVIMAPADRGSQQPYLPPPSVPQERR